MTTYSAQPMPELGLELVRDVDRERFRSRLPRWDPRLWGDAQFLKNTRPGNRLLKLGLAWGRERVKAGKLQQENVTPWSDVAPVSRFTGKEEDVEVGLQYFGKRYLSPYLGRWISADPLAVHAPGEADLNLYAYVQGKVLSNIDPLGLADRVAEATKEFKAKEAEYQQTKSNLETEIAYSDHKAEEVAKKEGDITKPNFDVMRVGSEEGLTGSSWHWRRQAEMARGALRELNEDFGVVRSKYDVILGHSKQQYLGRMSSEDVQRMKQGLGELKTAMAQFDEAVTNVKESGIFSAAA